MKVNPGFFINKFLRLINRPALRNCSIEKTAKVGTGSNCIEVQIGRYSYMGKNNSVANTRIGSFCSIASYCAIGGGAHPLDMISTSPVFYSGKNVFNRNFGKIEAGINKPVVIGNDVWIGEAVFINDGITIGDGAIIGAHSVVTHDVPAYSIVAGAPAKVIRYRFAPEKIEKLLKIKWWEWPEEKLKEHGDKFVSVDQFLGEMKE
ncbi:MAG: CatB-related O-acetyltransferase [Lachnospiraceae bacterium]|nr:CatB-related O-acetyltransferase [Lachnospiraceae bacterium]